MRKPLAVIINDVHYSVKTLELANSSMKQAINKAALLRVPLVIAGDLNDTKAIIRGEVANALLERMEEATELGVTVLIAPGNHDRLNEKAEEHSLNFLAPAGAKVIDGPYIDVNEFTVLPYYSDGQEVTLYAKDWLRPGSILIMHQGVKGAYMGDYVVDKTSIDPAELAHLKVFSGHYHRRQTVGTVTYLGNPYTLTFGEANDPQKGFNVLYSDGTLEHVPTNLRRHIIVDAHIESDDIYSSWPGPLNKPGDLIWLKLQGSVSDLGVWSRERIASCLKLEDNFKLDKIPTDEPALPPKHEGLTNEQMLDGLVDDSVLPDTEKLYIKGLWREVMS